MEGRSIGRGFETVEHDGNPGRVSKPSRDASMAASRYAPHADGMETIKGFPCIVTCHDPLRVSSRAAAPEARGRCARRECRQLPQPGLRGLPALHVLRGL